MIHIYRVGWVEFTLLSISRDGGVGGGGCVRSELQMPVLCLGVYALVICGCVGCMWVFGRIELLVGDSCVY